MEELGPPFVCISPSPFIQAFLPKFLLHHADARRKGTLTRYTKCYYDISTFILTTVEPVISGFVNLV